VVGLAFLVSILFSVLLSCFRFRFRFSFDCVSVVVEVAVVGDWIGLDTLIAPEITGTALEMVFLVNEDTAWLLSQSQFSYSGVGHHWNIVTNPVECVKTRVEIEDSSSVEGHMRECSVRILDRGHTARHFRVALAAEPQRHVGWAVYDLWLRGVASS